MAIRPLEDGRRGGVAEVEGLFIEPSKEPRTPLSWA
jgi:hypothetical protein